MLTLSLFACPKPFTDDHIRTIQRNAVRSWLLLQPQPQVLLFGSGTGTAETCAEFSLIHVPEVNTNEFGRPSLDDVFRKAEELCNSDLLCYVNADIILMSDFVTALHLVSASKHRFLMGARPWNLDIKQELSFGEGWEYMMCRRVATEGELRSERSCDLFAFPRGLWRDLPAFAVGRAYFDNALLRRVRPMKAAIVDATSAIVAVHQNHGYAKHLGGGHHADHERNGVIKRLRIRL